MFFDPAYQSLKNGLVGYWSPVATGPTGLQLLDLSGQNNHGTLYFMDAATDWVSSKNGTVIDFDGTDDVVQAPAPVLSQITTDVTLSFWSKLNATGLNSALFCSGINVPNNERMTAHAPWSDNNIYWDFGEAGGNNRLTVTGQTWNTTDWNHLVFQSTRQGLRVYRNGLLVGSTSVAVTRTASLTQTFDIGRSVLTAGTFRYSGQIGECVAWNRGLTASEVQTLYNLGPGKLIRSKPTGGPSKRKWWPGVKTPKSRPIIPTQRGIKSGPIFYDPKAAWFRNGLVGHWCSSITGPTGSQLLDLSGYGRNGSFTGVDVATAYGNGTYGTNLTLNPGSGGAVDCGRITQLESASSLTISSWNKWSLNSASQAGFISYGRANSFTDDIFLFYSSGQFQIQINNGTDGGRTYTASVPSDWEHYCVTYQAGVVSFYINGDQKTLTGSYTYPSTTAAGTPSNVLRIGGYISSPTNWQLNGSIIDTAIWNRALTSSEVQQLYRRNPGGFVARKPYRNKLSYSPAPKKIFKSRIDRKRSVSLVHPDQDNQWITNGLVGFWCPSLTGATGTQLLDLSGQNNNGTLTNMDAPTDWVDSAQGLALDIYDNQSVNCGTMNAASFGGPFAVSCWIRNATSSGTDFGIVTKLDFANTYAGWGLLSSAATNGKLLGFWANATRVTGATTITQNANWLHVGLYWTGSVAGVIVNGAIDATGNTTTAPNATADALHIGRYVNPSNRSIRGQITGVSVWNRSLLEYEWQTLYQLGPRMGFSRSPSRSPTWMVEADETIGNRRRRIICGGKN